MKKTTLLCLGLSVLLLTHAGAAPQVDAAPKPWAAGAVKRLKDRKIMQGRADGRFHGDQPVTRYELAVALDRLVQVIEATHPPRSVQKKAAAPPLTSSSDPAVRAALARLSANKFISSGSPLLQGNHVVTARELTTVLSQVALRLSDRSLPPTTH